MRRRLATSALCLAVSALPLSAQMRGGVRSGPPRGVSGFGARGPVTFRSAPGFSSTPRFGTTFASGPRFGIGTGFGGTVRFGRGFRGPFIRPRRFHRPFFFYSPWFYGYSGYPGFYPYPSYYVEYSYTVPYSYTAPTYYDSSPSYALQNDVARQQEDIDRLEDEVARLRQERETRQVPPPQASGQKNSGKPTLLVFRDQHTREVRNYAIVGPTLWIFNERRAEKLPLTSIDIDATRNANDERGLDFNLPK